MVSGYSIRPVPPVPKSVLYDGLRHVLYTSVIASMANHMNYKRFFRDEYPFIHKLTEPHSHDFLSLRFLSDPNIITIIAFLLSLTQGLDKRCVKRQEPDIHVRG